MADKRQRSKQRQAERRAQRLAERGDGGARPGQAPVPSDAEREDRQELEDEVDLQVGAPPEDLGTSEFTTRHEEAPAPDFEIDDEELADESEASGAAPPSTRGPRGVRGDGGEGGRHPAGAEHHERGRLLEFLKAVVAELRRVQWPDRKTLTQLTGVVLFFVVIVGAYLGALDAIFSKLIQSIL
jgi:preprotein translocase subunit SecE